MKGQIGIRDEQAKLRHDLGEEIKAVKLEFDRKLAEEVEKVTSGLDGKISNVEQNTTNFTEKLRLLEEKIANLEAGEGNESATLLKTLICA